MSYDGQLEMWDLQALETYGEVVGHFEVKEIPRGPAPDEIKIQWIGIPLAVREGLLQDPSTGPSDMPVASEDAVVALAEYGRLEAASYWIGASIFMLGYLRFKREEGLYTPVSDTR